MDITFLFYDGMTALDAVGPHEILSRLPGAKPHHVALKAGKIKTYSGLVLNAENSINEINTADILVIPGGGHASTLTHYPEILEWIKDVSKTTKWTTSVCTGSLILGAAGILSGVRATTHWAVMDRLENWGAIPVKERVVESGKIITSAGVSAGIDMALMLAAKVSGQEIADTLQLGIEYDPKPAFDVGSPDKASPIIVKNLLHELHKRFEQ